MKLKTVTIRNYRSIEEVCFDIEELEDSSFTYGLIGVNEAGKSSILKGMALRDGLKNELNEPLPLPKDFRDKTKPIEIEYSYYLDPETVAECNVYLSTNIPSLDFGEIELSKVVLTALFNISAPSHVDQDVRVLGWGDQTEEMRGAIQENLKKFILNKAHKSIFWTAEDRYLISKPINLSSFAANPDDVSVPLKNCFLLSDIRDIKERIGRLIGDSTEVEQLQMELGEKVTKHIRAVWPDHPIEITFLISDGFINFHVKDSHAEARAKTADQRSDGFKQMASFLLTISAENKNEILSNSVLLLDEPETHLHPQVQEDLLKELIKITRNERNNIVFFATHSNYMIDKGDLSRNYKIIKPQAETEAKKFDKKISTYAAVNYEVFAISSTDYHNELYGKLHAHYQDQNPNDDKREGILNFDGNFLEKEKRLKRDRPWKGNLNSATLPTYIRNCIHHPDNGDTYKPAELKKSIELLRSYL